MKLKILAGAYKDLSKGFRFYEAREKGLGNYFRETLLAEIDELHHSAGIHSVRFGKFHCKISRKFPYAIFYRIANGNVIIRAVLDCRTNPERVERRLK